MTASHRITTELDRLPRTLSLAVHELRTPLAIAAGYVRMLLREQAGAVTNPQRQMLEETAKSCARLGALIEEMSDLGRIEARPVTASGTSFDLSALVVEVGGAATEGEGRGIRLETRTAQSAMVAGDRVRIGSVLRALVRAALRERDEPGVVVAECSVVSDDGRSWAIVTIGDDTTTRTLLDAARDVPAWFDEWREGLGFALPMGRRVIEAHGGTVWSLPVGAPRGATAIRLPVAAQGHT